MVMVFCCWTFIGQTAHKHTVCRKMPKILLEMHGHEPTIPGAARETTTYAGGEEKLPILCLGH